MPDKAQMLDRLDIEIDRLVDDAVARERDRVFLIAIKYMPHDQACQTSWGYDPCYCGRPRAIDALLAEVLGGNE